MSQNMKDPNYCVERYNNPKKCKANNCRCVPNILETPLKCVNCDCDIYYDFPHHDGHCVSCLVDNPSAGLFD